MDIISKTMTLKGEDVPYLTYNKLNEIPFILHAFSTRLGGVSEGDFASMNLCFNRGDSDKDVTENYHRICDSVGFDFSTLTASVQIHEANVRRVSSLNRGVGIYKPQDETSVDALITNDRQVTLVTYYADCTPIFFVDTVNKAIGLAHAGWRGTVLDIAGNVVRSMTAEFGTVPEELICAVGPVIGKCCYEVSEECKSEFSKLFSPDSGVITPAETCGKYMIDLALANKLLLIRSGVKKDNIVLSDLCTRCNSDLLWSHRATGGKRGGMCAMMTIK